MNMDEYEEADKAALAMEERGGSFIQTLGRALKRADMANTEKLKDAFPEYFEAYKGKVDEGIVEVDKYEDKDVLTPKDLEALSHGVRESPYSEDRIEELLRRIENTKSMLYGVEQ